MIYIIIRYKKYSLKPISSLKKNKREFIGLFEERSKTVCYLRAFLPPIMTKLQEKKNFKQMK